jgi:hypothetical protein
MTLPSCAALACSQRRRSKRPASLVFGGVGNRAKGRKRSRIQESPMFCS